MAKQREEASRHWVVPRLATGDGPTQEDHPHATACLKVFKHYMCLGVHTYKPDMPRPEGKGIVTRVFIAQAGRKSWEWTWQREQVCSTPRSRQDDAYNHGYSSDLDSVYRGSVAWYGMRTSMRVQSNLAISHSPWLYKQHSHRPKSR